MAGIRAGEATFVTGSALCRISLAAAALVVLAVNSAHAQQGACIVGQRVLVDPGNHPATVLDNQRASCRVHYEDGAFADGWTYTFNIKPGGSTAAGSAITATGPRLGRYNITVGTGFSDGVLVLTSNSSYELLLPGGNSAGTGQYQFDTASHRFHWISGPLTDPTWNGTQQLEADGAMLKIRIGARAVATNTGQ